MWPAESFIAAVVATAIASSDVRAVQELQPVPETAVTEPQPAAPSQDPQLDRAGEAGPTSPRETVRVSPPARTPGADIDPLLKRAEARQQAGDHAGALTLLAEALDIGSTHSIPTRSQAEVLLALVDAHEGLARTGHPGHADIADDLRAGLLKDRHRLQLTDAEIHALRTAGQTLETDASPTPADLAPPAHARTSRDSVAEKVIEAEILSDRKMISAGTTMFVVGAGFAIGGGALLIYADATERTLSEYKVPDQEDERKDAIRDGAAQNGSGIAFAALGGVLVLTGIILLSVGVGRKRHKLGKDRRAKKVAEIGPVNGSGILGMKF